MSLRIITVQKARRAQLRQQEIVRQARLSRERAIERYMIAELVACEAVEAEDKSLVHRSAGREFLIEIKVHEVTDDGR